MRTEKRTDVEARPHAMVQAARDALRLDPGRRQQTHDLERQVRAPLVRLLRLVVLRRETIETKYIIILSCQHMLLCDGANSQPYKTLLVDELRVFGRVD